MPKPRIGSKFVKEEVARRRENFVLWLLLSESRWENAGKNRSYIYSGGVFTRISSVEAKRRAEKVLRRVLQEAVALGFHERPMVLVRPDTNVSVDVPEYVRSLCDRLMVPLKVVKS